MGSKSQIVEIRLLLLLLCQIFCEQFKFVSCVGKLLAFILIDVDKEAGKVVPVFWCNEGIELGWCTRQSNSEHKQ